MGARRPARTSRRYKYDSDAVSLSRWLVQQTQAQVPKEKLSEKDARATVQTR